MIFFKQYRSTESTESTGDCGKVHHIEKRNIFSSTLCFGEVLTVLTVLSKIKSSNKKKGGVSFQKNIHCTESTGDCGKVTHTIYSTHFIFLNKRKFGCFKSTLQLKFRAKFLSTIYSSSILITTPPYFSCPSATYRTKSLGSIFFRWVLGEA